MSLFLSVFLLSAIPANALPSPYPYIVTRWVDDLAYTPGEALTVTMRITANNTAATNVLYMNYSELFDTLPGDWNLSALELTDPSGRVSFEVLPQSSGAVDFEVNLADGVESPLEFSYSIPVPETITGLLRITAWNFVVGTVDNTYAQHDPVVTDLYPSGELPEIDMSDEDALDNYISQLRQQGDEEGWSFEVDDNGVIIRDSGTLLGTTLDYRPPENELKIISFPKVGPKDLPDMFDWRGHGPDIPVGDQGNCGACWAFALVGVAERLVAAKDGVSVKFSEQWVLDCNPDDWNCNGGWNPYEMFVGTDECGESGLVLNAGLPYEESKLDCACDSPRTAPYAFSYVGTIDEGLPLDEKIIKIKQAIMEYGPVWTTVHAGTTPFLAYSGGVFNYNKSDSGSIDHAVVIEGWDDTSGDNGVWILRNSWSDLWGEDGYMYIEYDSSLIGSYTDVMSYAGSLNGSIQVTIEPAEAIAAGAQWSVDEGTTWLASGDTSPNMAPGNYTVIFNEVTGFTSPDDIAVVLDEQENEVHTATYESADGAEGEEGETAEEGELETLNEMAVFLLDQFTEFDDNDDNMLRLEEVQDAIEGFSENQFDLLDGDGDNFITRDELQSYINGVEPACCGGCSKSTSLEQRVKDYLADWLLVGLTILTLVSISAYAKDR